MDWGQYQVLAISEVFEQKETYLLRKICRDYSSKFHTPLHEVYKLPFHFVLTNWMEYKIENLDEKALKDLSQDVIGIDESEETLIQEQIKKWEQDFKNQKKKIDKKTESDLIVPDFQEKVLDFSDLQSEVSPHTAPLE